MQEIKSETGFQGEFTCKECGKRFVVTEADIQAGVKEPSADAIVAGGRRELYAFFVCTCGQENDITEKLPKQVKDRVFTLEVPKRITHALRREMGVQLTDSKGCL